MERTSERRHLSECIVSAGEIRSAVKFQPKQLCGEGEKSWNQTDSRFLNSERDGLS